MAVSVRALIVAGALLVPALAIAQSAPPKPAAAGAAKTGLGSGNYRAGYAKLAKLPDWGGVWAPDWSSLFPRGSQRERPAGPVFTPAGEKLAADYKAGQAEGKNTQTDAANCVPPGMPQIMRMPYPIEFLFTPERVTIITETESQVRRIYTDGRKLPDDPDPAFNGSSIGHWEGNDLVVETVALNPRNSIMGGIHATEQTRIVERFHEEKPGTIVVQTTVTDPTLFAQPYTMKQAYVRKPDWEIREYVCQENNRDAADEFGRPSMDIK